MAKNKQINFRVDDEMLNVLGGICEKYSCSNAKVINTAIWTLVDVLYEGDEYENKISLLKKSVEDVFRA